MHRNHISQSYTQPTSHHSHNKEVHNLRCEMDRLCQHHNRKVWIREERTPTPNQSSSFDDDQSYRQSRTPTSESFTASSHLMSREKYRRKRSRTPPWRNAGNDAMGKALLQISCSPSTRHIQQAELPCHFNQPTFTIYNGKTNPLEHVNHFNQRMPSTPRIRHCCAKCFP